MFLFIVKLLSVLNLMNILWSSALFIRFLSDWLFGSYRVRYMFTAFDRIYSNRCLPIFADIIFDILFVVKVSCLYCRRNEKRRYCMRKTITPHFFLNWENWITFISWNFILILKNQFVRSQLFNISEFIKRTDHRFRRSSYARLCDCIQHH